MLKIPKLNNLLLKANNFFSNQKKIVLYFESLIFVVFLGIIDHLIRREISFSLIYLSPVIFATWYLGKNGGINISLFSAFTWVIADLSGGQQYSYFLIPCWNGIVRLIFFAIITYLLSLIKTKLEAEEKMADTDFLTGLANSNFFYEKVQSEIYRLKRYNRIFSLMYLDLDNFKYINDSHGHDAGDELLQKIAVSLQTNTRLNDVIARLGGDEFTGLFPETDEHGIKMLIEKMADNLSQNMKEKSYSVTFSIGAITFKKAPSNAKEAIKSVDNLMYQVKRNGKNNVAYEISA